MPKYHLTPRQRRIVLNLFKEFSIDPDSLIDFGGEDITEIHLAEFLTATQGFSFYLNRFAEEAIRERLFDVFVNK